MTLYFPSINCTWQHSWSQASVHVAVVWKDRHFHNEDPSSSLLPLSHLSLQSVTSYGHLFGWFMSAALGMSPAHLFAHFQPAGFWGRWGLEQVLTLWQYCSAIVTTLVWHQCCSSYKCSSTILYGLLQGKLFPDPVHMKNWLCYISKIDHFICDLA